jgi:hypothetical protein
MLPFLGKTQHVMLVARHNFIIALPQPPPLSTLSLLLPPLPQLLPSPPPPPHHYLTSSTSCCHMLLLANSDQGLPFPEYFKFACVSLVGLI